MKKRLDKIVIGFSNLRISEKMTISLRGFIFEEYITTLVKKSVGYKTI